MIAVVTYFSRRRRCPRRDPLCRPDRPCLQCYRELYRGHLAKPDWYRRGSSPESWEILLARLPTRLIPQAINETIIAAAAIVKAGNPKRIWSRWYRPRFC